MPVAIKTDVLFYNSIMKNSFFIFLLCAAFNSYADGIAEGRAKAEQACVLCHGPTGLAILPNAANLAGQQPIYLSEQLKNYRSGKRQNEVMNMIAKQLTDLEITNLSAWYSAIKITVEVP